MTKTKQTPTFSHELRYLKSHRFIAGVDEVGVAPLAGPVVAAAVILNPQTVGKLRSRRKWWYQVRDSKMLSYQKREELVKKIFEHSISVGVGGCSVLEIDELNIFQARLLSMKRAVENLKVKPKIVLIDGNNTIPDFPSVEQTAIVKGDVKVLSIACASIVAKVTRDNILLSLHQKYPEYGFDKHKGYPTAYHRLRIEQFGPCEEHRRTFSPVRSVYLSK